MLEEFISWLGEVDATRWGLRRTSIEFADIQGCASSTSTKVRGSEWSLQFRTTIEECDVMLFQQIEEYSGRSDTELAKVHVESTNTERPLEKSAMLCNR